MGWTRAGAAADLREKRAMAVRAGSRSIVLFAEGDRLYAVDNRCPHLGFPLLRGTLKDGILTCHWHAWQFDASCGACFTQGGSPVPTFAVEARGPDLWVDVPEEDPAARDARARAELDAGLERFDTLRLAKAAHDLLARGADPRDLVDTALRYGVTWREDVSTGLVVLAAAANLVRDVALAPEARVLALVHGLRWVAGDIESSRPRRRLGGLPGTLVSYEQRVRWFRGFVRDREEEAAERVLSSVVETAAPERVEAMLHAALADFVFLDGGHAADFANKAFELLAHAGWRRAPDLLPALVRQLCRGTRHEEDMTWKQPHDLVALAAETVRRMDSPPGDTYARAALVEAVLADDPDRVADGLVRAAAAPIGEVALAVALAAAIRLGRFHTRNEFADWDWAHHAFSNAQALRRMAVRAPSPALRTLVVQSAFHVFLARFLNIPKHAMPHDRGAAPAGAVEDIERGLELRRVDEIDAAVAAVFRGPDPAALGRFVGAALREDLGFHGFQELEAAVALHRDLAGTPQASVPLAAAARFLAAHGPTPRTVAQTVSNAIKLQRGEILHE